MAKIETKTEVKVAAPKGTQKSEAILGTASVKLETGVRALELVVETISMLPKQIADNLLIISDQENKIAEQALELKNSIAQNKIELGQAYERDKVAFVNEWLQANNKVAVDQDELEELREELSEALANTEKEVAKEVGKVTGIMKAKHESELREKALEFTAKEAQNMAALGQKDEKIKFLEEQVKSWQTALDKEREASVARAQAGTVQQTFTNGK